MTLDEFKKASQLITYFQGLCKEKRGRAPVVNRNKVKYLLVEMLQDLSIQDIKDLMKRYVKTDLDPKIMTLCYEYDTMLEDFKRDDADLERRKQVMKNTEAAVREFRKGYQIDQ